MLSFLFYNRLFLLLISFGVKQKGYTYVCIKQVNKLEVLKKGPVFGTGIKPFQSFDLLKILISGAFKGL